MQASVVNVYYYMRMILALTCTNKHAAYSLLLPPGKAAVPAPSGPN